MKLARGAVGIRRSPAGEDDLGARALCASLGFRNCEGGPDGPVNYYYEREL